MNAEELGKLYAENIKRIRLEKNLSQEELAEKADISSAYVSEIENQKKIGKFETIASLADALEVEPYELFLPVGKSVSYDSRRAKSLMNRLRMNFSELVDTMEEFLAE
jgi:transcriptional regulator with XRE-family HTH domain